MNRTRFFAATSALCVFSCASFAAALAPAFAADPPDTAVPTPAPAATATPSPVAPVIEPAAIALLQKAENAMFALRTYQADCWTTLLYDPAPDGAKPRPTSAERASLVAAKPNKMRYDQWAGRGDAQAKATDGLRRKQARSNQTPEFTFVCDGKTNWRQYGTMYRTDTQTDPKMLSTILEPWVGFYAKSNSPYGALHYYQTQKPSGVLEVRTTGREAVNGVPCDKIFTHTKSTYNNDSVEYRTTWYIGSNDGLVRRRVQWVSFGGKPGYTSDAVLHNIRVNAPVANPAKTFAYTPPKGVQKESERIRQEPKLLAKGMPAPNFTALDKNNQPVKLSDFKGKVVVVDFWASWCPPCIASMPHNQEVTQKLQKEGVPFVLLAVDNSEDRSPFLEWVKKHEPDMNALVFVHADRKTSSIANKQYHVSGIPTQYVIDANGVIRASFVGYGGPTDDLEKAVRAAAAPK